MPVQQVGEAVGAQFRLGTQAPLTITLNWSDGKAQAIKVTAADEKFGSEKAGFTTIPAASLNFQGMGIRYFLRPRPIRYTAKQQQERLEQWLKMPSAIERFIKLDAIPDNRGVNLYLDDRYAGHIATSAKLQSIAFSLPPAATVRGERSYEPPEFGRYLPVNFAAVAQGGAMRGATSSLAGGMTTIEGIPMNVADSEHAGDISLVRQMKGSWALECDEYLSRTTFDGMPESQLTTVPQAYYHRAWVLLAVDPDPKKDPFMTVRLTRFAGGSEVGRGGAIADAGVQLPRAGDPVPADFKKVGTVRSGNADLPLYLVQVDLPLGEILDLLSVEKQDPAAELKIGPYLDFEILGRCGEVNYGSDQRHKPTDAPSAANVFAVTLERAPAELRLLQSQPGNIFYNDETPATSVTVRATEPGTYAVNWQISDAGGAEISKDSKSLQLSAGEEAQVPLPVQMPKLGYYGLKLSLGASKDKRPLLQHEASFALLGPDTREAGYESPYSVWWYSGSHLTTGDIKIAGPLHLKAGIRRTISRNFSEAEMAPWKLTLASFGNLFGGAYLSTMDTLKPKVEENLAKLRQRYPHCDNVLIFHEGLPNTMPEELAGAEPKFDDKQREATERRAKLANAIGTFYREKCPDLKILVGNNSGSAKVIADLFRFGFDPKYADFIGIEATGLSIMPEAMSVYNTAATWMSREISRKYGHEMPVSGTYEFTYRREQAIGAQTQADWYVRDLLMAHAFGFKHIGPAALDDQGSSYYNTDYGGVGIVQRTPLLYPKPAYVGIATATRVLDKAQVIRVLPTGSLTVYAVELRRDRSIKDFAYAMWTPRGDAELTYDFGQDLEASFVEFYGNSRTLKTTGGRLTVPTSTAATYLVSPVPARTVSVSGRTYPQDQPPAGYRPASQMDRLTEWATAPSPATDDPFFKPGDFSLRETNDPQKGACLELALNKPPSPEPLVGAQVTLVPKQPLALPGKPHTIGLWVKGNSSWSRLRFVIKDAQGKFWRSNGNDWPADLAVNFDGWCFVRFCLDPRRSSIKNMSPGAAWAPADGGSGEPVYPVHIAGLEVTTYQKALDPVEMREVPPILRFRDIGAYE